MKYKIALSIALVLGIVLISLVNSDSTVKAQNQTTTVADTGVVTLGENQILRVKGFAKTISGDGIFRGVLRRLSYMQVGCNGGACKQMIASQTTSGPIELMPNEAFSYDLGDSTTHEVRAVIFSNTQDVKVTAMIIDATTNEVDAFFEVETDFRRCVYPLCGG